MAGHLPFRAGSRLTLAVPGVAAALLLWNTAPSAQRADVPLSVFARAASPNESDAREALSALAGAWDDRYAAIVLELAEMNRGEPTVAPPVPFPERGPRDPFGLDATLDHAEPPRVQLRRSPIRERLLRFLGE